MNNNKLFRSIVPFEEHLGSETGKYTKIETLLRPEKTVQCNDNKHDRITHTYFALFRIPNPA